uniref:Uncharacterized protein n=1 Tax=Ascaris lumbricoides TaxID=6252 RepID=A0A0M3IUS2_ASCLU
MHQIKILPKHMPIGMSLDNVCGNHRFIYEHLEIENV